MDKVINDKVFGTMSYNYSWEKIEKLSILGNNIEIRVVVSAYDGQEILDNQRKAYTTFIQKIEEYNKEIPAKLLSYYLDNYDYIASYVDVPTSFNRNNITEQLIVKMIRVKTVYFDRKGQFGYLCDCAWDEEHGILILLSGDSVVITDQDEII